VDFPRRFQIPHLVHLLGIEEGEPETTERRMSNLRVAVSAPLIFQEYRRGVPRYDLHRGFYTVLAAMAFESENKRYPCGICGTPERHFKMYRSDHAEHLRYDGEGTVFRPRICKGCELAKRMHIWDRWSEDQKKADPTYATLDAVGKTFKLQCKGQNWFQTGVAIKKAREEVREEVRLDRIELNKAQVAGSTMDDMASTTSLSTASKSERQTAVLWDGD